ncbi:hypothetical protein RJ639_036008, partial [Escallonia herrerae]
TGGVTWVVPTGRRDGRVSLASDTSSLPGFTDSMDVQRQKFAAKGLNTQDLVTLVGGHTIGTSACQFFRYRLNNFNSTTAADPSINSAFLPQLQSLCPATGDATKRVGLDNGSEDKFDTSFYTNLGNGRGILESDQKLWTDASTKPFVQRFMGKRGLAGLSFNIEFGKSMVKMSNTGVKTGTNGEIRKTGGVTWVVPTGRRDGRVSLASDTSSLPGFTDSMDVQKQKFAAKGLNTQDLVTLVGKRYELLSLITLASCLGGHTIGTSACQFFRYRLNNFNSTTAADPSINSAFLPQLQSLCPATGDGAKRVGLDNGSENKFDASFYTNLGNGRGILESDQKLWTDASTKPFVQRFMGIRGLAGLSFNIEFGKSMVKMSNTGVKTGTNGEIRKVCSAIN